METVENKELTQVSEEVTEEKQVEKPKKQRMIEQDIAKGIAIILVMALHTLCFDRAVYEILGGLFGFIMPFFFFMSGYNHRTKRYTYKQIIVKRIKQILIPFAIYSISITAISSIYYIVAKDYTFKMVLDTYLSMLLGSRFASQINIVASMGLSSCIIQFWFILMLFSATLIFYLVADYALEKASRLISIIIGLIAISMVFGHFKIHLPFYLAEAPAICAIMLIGAFFGQKELLSNKTRLLFIIINSIIAYALFVVLALLFKGSGFIAGGMLWDNRINEWAIVLSVAFSVLGTYAFVHFCRLLNHTGIVAKGLIWCGNNSMKLLFLHGVTQLYVCVILKMEPFRMSIFSHENDFRTLYVLALEIALSVIIIILIDLIKKLFKKKKEAKIN